MPNLVVVVVSYNVRDLLRRCLSELRPRLAEMEAEVVVVDNASSDGTVEMVRSEFPDARVIANSGNLGFSRANNQAMRATDSRYVLLLNSDAFLGEHALEEMLRVMESDARIAVVGPRMRNGQGERLATAHAFETLPRLAVTALGLQRCLSKAMAARIARYFGRSGVQHLANYEATEPQPADWVSGACMLVRRSAAQQVGLLDEGFFIYMEDEDWCRRFWQAGFRVVYAPSAQIVHLVAGATSATLRFARLLRDSRLRYHRRYHPHLYPAFWLLAQCYAIRQCGLRAFLSGRAQPGLARPQVQESGA
jgi:GT2 family glycosyltransferase